MSDNIPPSIYAGCTHDKFADRFRRLMMHLFLDDLSLGQVEKVFFICKMPQRLKDDGTAQKFRFEVLTYVEQQLLDEWIQTPSALQNILEEVGRTDMSKKVQDLVAEFPQEQMFQTYTVPPVQEMTPSLGKDFCGSKDKSSTCEAMREPQPQAVNLQSLRFPGKHPQEYMEKIPEESSMSHNEERRDSLKRTSSTASEARSSGYFSNPRGSELRFSQLSITESSVEQAEKGRTLLTSIKQTNCEVDEGLMMEIDQTHEFVNSLEKDENEVAQNGTMETKFSTQNDDGGEETEFRPRCYQLTVSPSHVRSPFKVNVSELQPQNRIRSKSLPNSSRHLHNVALHSTISPPYPSSNSSCTSLDSETTNGSPSEASSFAGSQLSLASANSDSKPNSLRRRLSPPQQKPYPVDSQVNISGSMELKTKNILKSVEKKDQTPLTSEKFPSSSGHHGPYYEIRFIPSDFSKKSASLYIDVAQSYLRKKAKSKNHSAVEIPAINITVSLSESTGNSTSDKREIKSVNVQTDKKMIDSHAELQKKVVVASFPQLVSHAELNLSESEGRSLVILVKMCYQ